MEEKHSERISIDASSKANSSHPVSESGGSQRGKRPSAKKEMSFKKAYDLFC